MEVVDPASVRIGHLVVVGSATVVFGLIVLFDGLTRSSRTAIDCAAIITAIGVALLIAWAFAGAIYGW